MVFGIAVALSSAAATSAGATEFVFAPSFSHTIQLTSPPTNQSGALPTSQYLTDADGKGAGYTAEVRTAGTSAFFFASAIAAGQGNLARSVTRLDLNFTSTGGEPLKGIESTIFPATFGLYVAPFTESSGCSGATLPTCKGIADTGTFLPPSLPTFRTLTDGGVTGSPFESGQAGSSFLFELLVNNNSVRSIGGTVVMQDRGFLGLGEPNILASSFINGVEGNIDLLADQLPGFTKLYDDRYNLIWGWDESPFVVDFPGFAFNGAGQVTYRITTTAWGDSRRLVNVQFPPTLEDRSIIAFSCFADPVGRGSTRGTILPTPNINPVCDEFGGFDRDYRLLGGDIDPITGRFSLKSVVPEPDTWGMLIVGFGLIGLSMRRSKKAVPATAS